MLRTLCHGHRPSLQRNVLYVIINTFISVKGTRSNSIVFITSISRADVQFQDNFAVQASAFTSFDNKYCDSKGEYKQTTKIFL